MLKLLALLGAFFIAGSAYAADWPAGEKYNQVTGTRVTLNATSTQEAVDFGFRTSAVRICVVADSGGGSNSPTYVRVGTTLTATQSSDFIDGDGNQGANPAMVIGEGGDGTDRNCEIYPFVVRGLIFHATLNSTVDVNGYR